MSSPSPRYPFNTAPFSISKAGREESPAPPRALPDSQIYYVDKGTGMRLSQTVQPLPPKASPRHHGLPVLHIEPAPPSPSPQPTGMRGGSPPRRPISSALLELDRLFEATAVSLQPPSPLHQHRHHPLPLYRDHPAALAAPAARSGDLSPLRKDAEASPVAAALAAAAAPAAAASAPILASPGSRLLHLIEDTREQIAQLKAVLAASRALSQSPVR